MGHEWFLCLIDGRWAVFMWILSSSGFNILQVNVFILVVFIAYGTDQGYDIHTNKDEQVSRLGAQGRAQLLLVLSRNDKDKGERVELEGGQNDLVSHL